MATVPTIENDHFNGGKNLTPGNTTYGNNDLATIIQAVETDIDAAEARLTSAEAHEADHIRGGGQEFDGDLLDVDFTPTNYTPTVTAPATHADHLTAHLSGIDTEMSGMAQSEGCAASVVMIQAGQPTTLDTITVGADIYEVDGVGANINFALSGVNAEGTLDNLLAAAVANGTENLFWEKLNATTLLLTAADGPQGTIIGSDPSIVLDSSSMTNYSFNTGDVNMNTLAGNAAAQQSMAAAILEITTAMITAGIVRVSFPFNPTTFQITAINASGALELAITDTFAISGNDILITLGGGGGDLANTDVVHIVAYA